MGIGELVFIISVVAVPLVFVVGILVMVMRLNSAARAFVPAPVYMPMQVVPLAPPAPTQIKKVSCRHCGALKAQPPRTACMYCDYCGSLVDWDFRIAATTAGSSQPGQELRRLMAHEKQVQDHARAVGDRNGYRASLMRVFQQHMQSCPAAYPPRVADPAYRDALLDFLATVDVEQGFDPQSQAHEAALQQAIAQLRVMPSFGGQRVDIHAFHRLLEAKKACTRRAVEVMEPHLDKHPDNPTMELAVAVIHSTFVQYWLPFLDPPQQDWLIRELGLAGEYVPITPVHTTERHCGCCANTLAVVMGAQRVICERCGRYNDVSRPEIPCGNCHAPVSVMPGVSRFACPYCRADMRAD